MCVVFPCVAARADSLAACCNALEPKLQTDPRNGQPRKDQVNGKAVCLSYKKTVPVVYGQPAPVRKYLLFKAQGAEW